MPVFLVTLLPWILLILGVFLALVGISPSFRSKTLNSLRGGRGWSHNTEMMVSWLSFIIGMYLISMIVPFQLYLGIVACTLIYFVTSGR